MILFLWKIGEGLVRGYDVSFTENDRRGRMAVVKPYVRTAAAYIRRAREASLGVKGCKLFNMLPVSLRNMRGTTLDSFKWELDKFLSSVPDQPTLACRQRSAETNSLLHQISLNPDL